MRIRHYMLAAMFPVLLPLLPAAIADDDAAADDFKRCINSRLIRSTYVENDRSVIFRMRGNKLYLNTLPAPCAGLAREGRFSYTSYTRSLCRHDLIHVLRDSGFGLEEGRTCRLGMFHLVTEQDLALMFEEGGEPRSIKEVETPAVEDVVEDDEEAPEESAKD